MQRVEDHSTLSHPVALTEAVARCREAGIRDIQLFCARGKREFYEKRQFTSGRDAVSTVVPFLGAQVPFGNDLIFEARELAGFKLHVELCEDVWAPIPPSPRSRSRDRESPGDRARFSVRDELCRRFARETSQARVHLR